MHINNVKLINSNVLTIIKEKEIKRSVKMKIDKKYENMLFGIFMAAGMSLFMSTAMLIKNMGITPSFFSILIREWAFGFLISLVPSILLPPFISKLISKLVDL